MNLLRDTFICLQIIIGCIEAAKNKFPEDFVFGAVTGAFAIEGAWNEDGKGESILDYLAHNFPQAFYDDPRYNETEQAEIAADSYHKWREDVRVAKKIGLDYYRFQISWSRILPNGDLSVINQAGVDYYNNLINALIAANINPSVTLQQYDPPMPVSYFGGLSGNQMIARYVSYADLAFKLFGDRVKTWITFNAPYLFCKVLYGDVIANLIESYPRGEYEYQCAHNIIRAHAKAYRLYEKKYKKKQGGQISMSLVLDWYEPATNSRKDKEAAKRAADFQFGWFAHPLIYGDYPQRMIDTVAKISEKQNYSSSRLPSFTKAEKKKIKGTLDYISLSPVQTFLVCANKTIDSSPSLENDVQISLRFKPEWIDPNALFVSTTFGFRKTVKYVWENYGQGYNISISENGYGVFKDSLNDVNRIHFLKDYLREVLLLIHEDKIPVQSYGIWSLIDLFFYKHGLKATFGLVHIDFNDPNRPRTLKSSARYYRDVIENRKL